MEFKETITLSGGPIPELLPRPGEELIALFFSKGFEFEDRGRTVRLYEVYNPTRLAEIKQILKMEKLDLLIKHSIWHFCEEEDYNTAPLWIITFPDLWIDEIDIDFKEICPACGETKQIIDENFQVDKVNSTKPFGCVNGVVDIVRNDVGLKMQETFTGVRLVPFDQEEGYYYLLAETQLTNEIVKESEAINYQGKCPACGEPTFDMWFGPKRYSKNEWSGDDVVFCEFYAEPVVTPKVYDFLRGISKSVNKSDIVLIE